MNFSLRLQRMIPLDQNMIAAAMWHSMQQAKRKAGQQQPPKPRYKYNHQRSLTEYRRSIDRRIINWFKNLFS